MTLEIGIVLAILAVAVVLFITEWIRMDVVALMVMVALALTKLISSSEALSGFSNPAVVTVWAMFIISGGLSSAGIANLLSRQMLKMGGHGEARLVATIMIVAGLLSAFMNNVGVAALMLPVVMDIARQTNRSPSKLLIPLTFGVLLGGLTTLIGTPPNILASDALHDRGLAPFRLFDFTPIGVIVMIAGVAFMVLVGRRLLPDRDLTRQSPDQTRPNLRRFYDLPGRLFALTLPENSPLVGATLAESRLGAALSLSVIAIIRNGKPQLAPDPSTQLQADDRLLVKGDAELLADLCGKRILAIEKKALSIENLISPDIDIVEVALASRSPLVGQTLKQIDFRRRYKVNVFAVRRGGVSMRTRLREIPLERSDKLLIQGPRAQIDLLREDPDFLVSGAEHAEVYRLDEQLIAVRVLPESAVAGKSLADSRLGDAFGLTVLGIIRDGTTHLMPDPAEELRPGDTLLVEGGEEALVTLRGLEALRIDRQASPDLSISQLQSDQVGLVEAVLSPHSTLTGKTLSDLHFREKYGLSVLAIWREGQVYHHNLRDMPLRFGDALLLYGPRQKLKVLSTEPDFLVLTETVQEAPKPKKAVIAVLVLAAILVSVLAGWVHISIAAVAGAALMVVTGCLSMGDAYRFIEWRAVFLIAGMLPLGIALERTGAARFLAEGVIGAIGGLGPVAVIAGLFILTSMAVQFIHPAALVVLMAPIAISTADNMGISPQALMMTVAVSASTSFMTPIYPANMMIMGPGGYRFTDYTKVGLPLTLVILAVVLLTLPLFWPLFPG